MEKTPGASASEKRRRRPPLACVACRHRKVRCDRKMPCQNCVRARKASSCVYVSDDRLELHEGTHGAHDSVHGHLSGHRSKVLNAPLGGELHSGSPSGSPASRHLTSETAVSENARDETAALAERVKQLEKQLKQVLDSKEAAGGAQGTESPERRHKHAEPTSSQFMCAEYWKIDGPRRSQPPIAGEVLPSGTQAMLAKSRYLGGSHWMQGTTLISHTKTLAAFLENVSSNKCSEVYQSIVGSKALGKSIKALRAPRVLSLDFGHHVPARAIADELLEAYLRTFETIHRIIHVPSFRHEYSNYWQNPRGARSAFVIQLQLCMAIGSLVHDDKYSMRSLAIRWIHEARLWLLQPSEKSRVDLSGLQIWCLVHLARDLCGVGSDLVWVSAGTLFRMALYMGLHRDPEHLPTMPLLEAETRRRLWATILEILVASSMESGGPPLVTMHDFDTRPPGNYNDQDLVGNNDPAHAAPSPRPLATHTDASIQIALFDSIKIRLEIATYLNDFRSASTYDKTLALHSDLTSASRRFDTLLRVYQSQQPGLSSFQAVVTEHMIQRYFLALHLPWLCRAKEDPRYYFSRKLCTDISFHNQKQAQSQGFLGSEDGHEPDDFGRILICASGGFRYTGILCLLVLNTDLIWQIDERRPDVRGLDTGDSRPAIAGDAPARTSGMGFGVLGPLASSRSKESLQIIHQATKWLRARIIAGDVNVKGYIFAAAMYAETLGLEQGLSDAELTPLVHEAATVAVNTSFDILKGLHATGLDTTEDRASASTSTTLDGTQVPDVTAEFLSTDPGSSSSMSDWDWDILGDPNHSFNVNMGTMGWIFESEGM